MAFYYPQIRGPLLSAALLLYVGGPRLFSSGGETEEERLINCQGGTKKLAESDPRGETESVTEF